MWEGAVKVGGGGELGQLTVTRINPCRCEWGAVKGAREECVRKQDQEQVFTSREGGPGYRTVNTVGVAKMAISKEEGPAPRGDGLQKREEVYGQTIGQLTVPAPSRKRTDGQCEIR